MQYDFRGSNPSGARNGNGNLSGLSRNGYRSAMETGPGVVPIQVYQQVAEELESARQQVNQLSTENQRLRSLHQQLSGEVAGLSQEFQGQLGHTLKRLQQIGQAAQAAAASEGGSPAPTPSFQRDNLVSDPSQPEAPPAYDFLNRLKRRQTRNETPSFPTNGYPEAHPPNANFAPPSFDLPRRPTQTPAIPPSGFARPRHDTPAESYPRAGYQVPSLDELMQDMGEPDSCAEAYPTGVYQRVREQHHGSQGSTVLWIAAAVILVIGSFGLGFVAVQPFLRNDSPPLPAQAP